MNATGGRPLPLWFSLLLATVLVGATRYALLATDAYRAHAGTPEQRTAADRVGPGGARAVHQQVPPDGI